MRTKVQDRQSLKIAAYIRVSTDKDDQENSFEVQKKYFELLLSNNPYYTDAGVYADFGASGTTIKHREGLQALLLNCKKGRVNRIVCKSISRIARNALEFLNILDVLKNSGVTIYFEKENIDTEKNMNDIAVASLAAIAQEESISISQHIRWADTKRYELGEVPNKVIYGYRWTDSSNYMPDGYRYRNIEVVPEEADTVRKIYKDVSVGIKYADIVRWLNTHNITPPIKKDSTEPCKKWYTYHIHNIISNERYCGCVLTQKTYTADTLRHKHKNNNGELDKHWIQNHHPAIVDKRLFELAQIIRRKNSETHGNNKTGSKRIQTLSGLLVCPICGRKLNCAGRNRVPYWFCPDMCGIKINESTVFIMLSKAMRLRFGEGGCFRKNIIKMYETTDHLTDERAFISNNLSSAMVRKALLENKILELKNKLSDIADDNIRSFIQMSIAALEIRLASENDMIDKLKKKSEECKMIADYELQHYDQQSDILTDLENCKDFEKNIEKVLQKNISGLLAKAIVHSQNMLSVYWADNTSTKIEEGVIYG